MTNPNHVIIEEWEFEPCLLKRMVGKKIINIVRKNGLIIIGKWDVNKGHLKRLLNAHIEKNKA